MRYKCEIVGYEIMKENKLDFMTIYKIYIYI